MENKSRITKEQYNKINYYFNELCCGLLRDDYFFLDNVAVFSKISSNILVMLEDYDLNFEKKDDCLTFFEIYEKSREVLKSISPKYLEDYDNIIPTGKLFVNYERLDIPYMERVLDRSFFVPHDDTIYINNNFNYDTIAVMIHEYMHKTNKANTIVRYLLTEYISIFFELYTYEYLKKNGIDKEKLSLVDRIKLFYGNLYSIEYLSFYLYTFDRLGNFDDDTYSKIDYVGIPKTIFEDGLLEVLEKFENIERRYNNQISDENKGTFRSYLTDACNNDYRYVIGTLLAYYSLYNVPKEKVLKLNETLADKKIFNIDAVLDIAGIKLNDDTINKAIESIERYIKENNLSKKEKMVIK